MNTSCRLELIAPTGLPLIEPGADLVDVILNLLQKAGHQLLAGDIVCVAQKIVSKAEGRHVNLKDVNPSAEAEDLAKQTHKDPRLVELILRETRSVLRCRSGILVVEHKLGFVLANAGVDASNVKIIDGERVLLLPDDPNRTAVQMRRRFEDRCGEAIGVIINESVGRAWRNGAIGTCIGIAGLPALFDL